MTGLGMPRTSPLASHSIAVGRHRGRREAAGEHHHEAAQHDVDAEREDHRRHAEIGDAEAVEDADQQADAEADRESPSGPPQAVASIAEAAMVHGTDRSIWPSRTTIIMPAATMPRKDATLSWRMQIGRREQRQRALEHHRVDGADDQDGDDEDAGEQQRPVDRRPPEVGHLRHGIAITGTC